MKKRVAVLGATGSIGKSTLDILREEKERFTPVLLTANKNADELKKLKEEFPCAAIALGKEDSLRAITATPIDITVNGISGAAGLEPSLEVIRTGSDLALANKETIVMAGPLVLAEVKKRNVKIIPVDSEHSAIWKLIEGHGRENVSEIILTASGGPLIDFTPEELETVTVSQALAHPTWKMGPKITIDSATMANKGLEVIEAALLFNIPQEKIKVTVHRQSIVHSMIRLKNGAVYAQMSKPDMKLPIHDALTFPDTTCSSYGQLDFDSLSLTFEKPDFNRFPMLNLAYKALEGGLLMPTVYNAGNEAAVDAFLEGRISFLEIPALVGYVLEKSNNLTQVLDLESIQAADRKARELANDFIKTRSI
ncbi:MAG: 1-deoxy-D-xylulose-5-phosphate reductoisomerase [Treponema sp.]|nr:1-deoxy-D-xylulose-5-phosphate reductoisomerase [Treponema sp.]